MRWPAAQLAPSSRVPATDFAPARRRSRRLLAFAGAELLLAMAIPFLAIEGYHTLLDSRSGTLVDEPTPVDPGWTAVVSPTPVVGVAEVVDGTTSGLALIVPRSATNPDSADVAAAVSTTVLVDGNTSVPTPDGVVTLSELEPAVALRTLAQSMKIRLSEAEVMDSDAWGLVFAGKTYELDNPDPVPNEAGTGQTLAFAVGTATVGGSNAAVFLGRPVDEGSLSSLRLRRQMLWEAMVEDPPTGTHRLAQTMSEAFAVGGQVLDLPTQSSPDGPVLQTATAEELVRSIVAFPSGERLKMRVVDRTGVADLEAVAAAVAARGIEIVEIANAAQFDDGNSELIVPSEVSVGKDQLGDLASDLGLDPLVDHELGSAESTLLIGADFDADALGWLGT